MERAVPFTTEEYYHVYTRGINKAHIFFNTTDWDHFQKLLFTRNSIKRIDSVRVKGLPLHTIDRGGTIVDIIAYALMPNHFHLLLHEKIDNGISTFMSKLSTAYAMYINTKYKRTGSLMCRPFRSTYINSNDQLRWCFSYIHTNPLELRNQSTASKFIKTFKYSSYVDYFLPERNESLILNTNVIPFNISELEDIATMNTFIQTNQNQT